jgi:hypothetical protein
MDLFTVAARVRASIPAGAGGGSRGMWYDEAG